MTQFGPCDQKTAIGKCGAQAHYYDNDSGTGWWCNSCWGKTRGAHTDGSNRQDPAPPKFMNRAERRALKKNKRESRV